ncbi:hypothetical protein BD410DRAFT_800528 [Rickenella mellea]|uniref:Uncharacterized protein n=1 Tax=Rickenella mellea TaxID=50990 RepID=A0A4Y7QI07_9AGAM|nr:hypothetical protein BD410DRAFT_800528 [Rickenella mellea]
MPNIEDIQIVDKVLDAAIKYEMERAVQEMCVLLTRNFCEHSPFRVYMLACKHKLKEEAKLAAKACLRVPIAGVFMPELASISGLEYFRLLDYQNKTSLAADAIMTLDSSGPKFWGLFHTRSSCGPQGMSKWWSQFISLALPILRKCPRSNAFFEPALLYPTLDCVAQCQQCRNESVIKDWTLLERLLKQEIHLRTENIELDLSGF